MDTKRYWASRQNVVFWSIYTFLFIAYGVFILLTSEKEGPKRYAQLIQFAPYCFLGVAALFLARRKPLLEISSSLIRYRGGSDNKFRDISVHDIEKIEWPGYDNIGIRLQTGEVVSISVMSLPKTQRDEALSAMRSVIGNRGA